MPACVQVPTLNTLVVVEGHLVTLQGHVLHQIQVRSKVANVLENRHQLPAD